MKASLFYTIVTDTVMIVLQKKVLRSREAQEQESNNRRNWVQTLQGKLLLKQAKRVGKEIRAKYVGWIIGDSPELEEEWRWWMRSRTWGEISWVRFACFCCLPRSLSKHNQPTHHVLTACEEALLRPSNHPSQPCWCSAPVLPSVCFLFPVLYLSCQH